VSDDRGLHGLLDDLGALRDDARSTGGKAPDAAFWLTLLALPLLLAEGALDAGRRRVAERGEAVS
jgi:hypothetical protein